MDLNLHLNDRWAHKTPPPITAHATPPSPTRSPIGIRRSGRPSRSSEREVRRWWQRQPRRQLQSNTSSESSVKLSAPPTASSFTVIAAAVAAASIQCEQRVQRQAQRASASLVVHGAGARLPEEARGRPGGGQGRAGGAEAEELVVVHQRRARPQRGAAARRRCSICRGSNDTEGQNKDL
ncbi:hypothetical protein PVAP13_9NG841000 [Panicum virgatum]|uniref:Uncharacterized protein n=1 Tax=Panicum virgatum TaxID=38727 RepID=A0A8T0N0P3_PANVG|nr:hypothetical protein PVAP13_9NG841000 [Panicum virgatum]